MEKIYLGYDVHAYTAQIRNIIDQYLPAIIEKFGDHIPQEEWVTLMGIITTRYGNKQALNIMKSRYNAGWIRDNDLPMLNSAVLLKAIWYRLMQLDDETIFRHFGETLDQIGATCIQGCSHRLFLDYVALTRDSATT